MRPLMSLWLLATRRIRRAYPAMWPARETLIRRIAPGRSFLDLGGMWSVHGRAAFLAEEAGASRVAIFDGMDPTEEFSEEHESRSSSVRFIQGDLHDAVAIEGLGRFDVVWCTGVLYHTPNPFLAIEHLRRLTNEIGYDGGAFFSPDSKQIVYRRSSPQTPAEIARYKELLSKHLVVPTVLEIWVMNADGSNKRQVTKLGAGSFAPFFTPDGKRIIFCTNYFDPEKGNRRRQPNFDLALINIDGTGLERVTYHETFDGFPMFSPDGKKLVFASNRNASKLGETNVFIADWVE